MDLRTRESVPQQYQINVGDKSDERLYNAFMTIKERYVLIEVSVCDTPSKGVPSEGTSSTHSTFSLSLKDYSENSHCLYQKLTEMLPLQQWSKVTAVFAQQSADASAGKTFEIFRADSRHEETNKIDNENVARENCREFLHDKILRVPDTTDDLRRLLKKELQKATSKNPDATSRPLSAILNQKIWRITLWRKIRLDN